MKPSVGDSISTDCVKQGWWLREDCPETSTGKHYCDRERDHMGQCRCECGATRRGMEEE